MTQRGQNSSIKVERRESAVDLPKRIIMSASFRPENKQDFTDAPVGAVRSSPAFDRDLAVKIGRYIAVRRSLCGLSKQQLGVRLGIASADVDAYEQGTKRISSRL